MEKETIEKNFSRCARYYDRYSSIQDLCATRLISKIRGGDFGNILDIGCGTGNYTRLLKERFPKAHIKAVDISGEMIKIAKEKMAKENIDFIIADGEMLNFNEPFDFISSNAAFQWFEDLDKTLSKYREFLNEKGIISFSTFGPSTFCELDTALKELFGKEISISSCYFIKREAIKKILEHLFKNVVIDEEIYKEDYNSLKELLKKIRYTGVKGNGTNGKNLWTSNIMSGLEEIYKNRFKKIAATYQIFLCEAEL